MLAYRSFRLYNPAFLMAVPFGSAVGVPAGQAKNGMARGAV